MRACLCVYVYLCAWSPRTSVRSRNAYQQLHLGLSVSSEPLFVREIECIFVTSMYRACRIKLRAISYKQHKMELFIAADCILKRWITSMVIMSANVIYSHNAAAAN